MDNRQPFPSRSLPANEERGGQGSWDGIGRADDHRGREGDRTEATLGEGKGVEADDNGEGSSSNSNKRKTVVRSTKKRRLPAAGGKPPLKRRIKRRRFTSPLPSDEEDLEGGYVLEGKIVAERKMTPQLGPRPERPRIQYLVQSWKEAPYIALPLLKDWRNRQAGEGDEELKLIRQYL